MKCICQICTCGRHHCPHLPTKIFDASSHPCHISEYTEKYPRRKLQVTKSFKPSQEYQLPCDKMESSTTSRDAFILHNVMPHIAKQPAAWKPNQGEMDMITSYSQEYIPRCIQKVASFRPMYVRPANEVKMESVATYAEDFRPWNEPRRESMKPLNKFTPPDEPFSNTTTSRDAYEYKGRVPTKNFKPEYVPRKSITPFDDVSNYKEAYVPHPVERPKFHVGDEYKPSLDKFESVTTNRQDFTGQPGLPAKSTKPEYVRPNDDIPFCSATTFRDAYTKKPLQERFKKRSVGYIPPVEKMDMQSTSHSDYIERRVTPRKSFRPVHIPGRNDVPFEGNSTMKEDFRPWCYTKMPPVKPDQQLHLSTEPFDGLTTCKQHYVQHPLARTTSFKPVGIIDRSNDPMLSESTYGTTYTPKEIKLCPARLKTPDGYVFQGVDTFGHQQFKTVYEAAQDSKEETGSPNSVPQNTLSPEKLVIYREEPRKLGMVCCEEPRKLEVVCCEEPRKLQAVC